MKLLHRIKIQDRDIIRTIGLYEGDLANLPAEHKLDILIISAFFNDYLPTPNSLVGALAQRGLMVSDLANDKEHDLRSQCSFGLSKTMNKKDLNINRVACFENNRKDHPSTLVGDLFRGLFPFLDPDRDQTVGMPLLSSGDQGWSRT